VDWLAKSAWPLPRDLLGLEIGKDPNFLLVAVRTLHSHNSIDALSIQCSFANQFRFWPTLLSDPS